MFIYCIDENIKNVLLSKGYNLIKEESMQGHQAWIFNYSNNIQFDVLDKSKYFISNQLNF